MESSVLTLTRVGSSRDTKNVCSSKNHFGYRLFLTTRSNDAPRSTSVWRLFLASHVISTRHWVNDYYHDTHLSILEQVPSRL